MAIRQFSVPSPVGHWLVETDVSQNGEETLVSIDWIKGREIPRAPETKLEKQLDCMLRRYFKGEAVDFSRIPVYIPPAARGGKQTMQKVMRALREIPAGQVHSYQWLAERLGIGSPRPVGNALGRNPIPIVVPCHRIVAADRKIGGFMRNHPDGGPIKRFLLELEGHRFEERNGALVLLN